MTTVYATAVSDGTLLSSSSTSYAKARQGDSLSADTTSASGNIGQSWNNSTALWEIWVYLCKFDVSGLTGTIQTIKTRQWVVAEGDHNNDQDYDMEVRGYDYGAGVTTGDWIAGGSVSAKTLYGSASSPESGGINFFVDLTALEHTICPDSLPVMFCSSYFTGGVSPGYDAGAGKLGYTEFNTADETGTTNDPYLSIVVVDNPTDCTISSPAVGSYSGSVTLTATATDPLAENVHYHWDYSTDGGANWSACPNSPSSSVTSGTAASITFDVSGIAEGTLVKLRVKAENQSTEFSLSYAYVDIARNSQTTVAIFTDGGTSVVSHSASGVVIERTASAPSTCSFMVDNFANDEASIDDDDEIVVAVPYYTVGSVGNYTWRGWVRQKRVGDMLEVYCEDIAYRFAKTRVTVTLSDNTVGSVVRQIVENPTGTHATGINATCDEVDDPANPGSYLMVSDFDGRGRSILDWLSEFTAWTGCVWWVYYDDTNDVWKFRWCDQTANPAWAVAVKDTIGFESESTSQTCPLGRPIVTVDRSQYANRVWYYTDTSYTLASVETAAVTAGTEEPEEILINTVATDATAAASLAKGYLDAYSVARETIEDVRLYGIREVDFDDDVIVTLTPSGISAVAYPILKIRYDLLELGHTTTLTLGALSDQVTSALAKLVRRITELQSERA